MRKFIGVAMAMSTMLVLSNFRVMAAEANPPPLPASLSDAARAQLSVVPPPAPEVSLEQMRAFSDQFQLLWSAKQKARYAVTTRDEVMAGVPVRVISPASHADPRRVFLNVHGGGFLLDSGSLTENVPIAALTGITVVAVRYRLAPEHPFPAAVDDALAVYRQLLKSHAAKHIGIFGTSAGAVLGPELVARILKEGLPAPGALGVFSGDSDLARPGDSLQFFPFKMGSLDYAGVRAQYAGNTSLADPALSPFYADLKGFPPTLCISSGRDFLLSGTINFCRRLGQFGVPNNLIVYEGLPHAFWVYIDAPESDEAFRAMADFLATHLGVPRKPASPPPPPVAQAPAAATAPVSPASSDPCGQLESLHLADTTIVSAKLMPAGPFKGAFMMREAQVPAHCRVVAVSAPEAGSAIRFEVWMPAMDWNGRLYGAGNGGFGGAISYSPGLVEAVQRGAVGVSTDTGHAADSAGAAEDGSWALKNPAKIRDYGYRAVHVATVNAKALIKAFYQRAADHAYFASCSNGGREALMEAQRYPEDFDGIIAGAPAFDWTGVASNFIWNDRAQRGKGAAIPASKVPALQAAVLKACASGKGWVNDPRLCRFNPETLECRGPDSNSCLTRPQVAALKKIYSGPHTSSGQSLYPGFPASGAELGSVPGSGWDGWILGQGDRGPSQPKYAAALLNFFAPELGTDVEHFDFDKDPKKLNAALAPELNATDPDLSPFAARGGKLILWHGWADPALPPQHTIDYFDSVQHRMGSKAADVVRLFLAPGVQHCFGGPGGNSFGQFTAPVLPKDSNSDMAAALEQWVEKGEAPKQIVAHHADNLLAGALDWRAADASQSNVLCPYPEVAARDSAACRNP